MVISITSTEEPHDEAQGRRYFVNFEACSQLVVLIRVKLPTSAQLVVITRAMTFHFSDSGLEWETWGQGIEKKFIKICMKETRS